MTEEIGSLHRDKQLLEETSEMSQARIKELEALVEKLQVPCFLFICMYCLQHSASLPEWRLT